MFTRSIRRRNFLEAFKSYMAARLFVYASVLLLRVGTAITPLVAWEGLPAGA